MVFPTESGRGRVEMFELFYPRVTSTTCLHILLLFILYPVQGLDQRWLFAHPSGTASLRLYWGELQDILDTLSQLELVLKSESMAAWRLFIFCLMVNVVSGNIGRSSFPKGFVFGTASSAYQYEGAALEGGRGPSIWDTYSHIPGTVVDGSNGDVAIDEYHRYKEDVQLMAKMGMDAYRFSISWSRIFPNGKGEINRVGIAYYNNLINELKKYGIEPYVTLYHWDLPQALYDAYGGWRSPMIVQDYVAYAETCFSAFGDRVKHWITFNEPYVFTMIDYVMGTVLPGRCLGGHRNCSARNSSVEPYIVAHNVLLSHASAVDVFRKKYWAQQGGSIGITLNINWFVAMSNSINDKEAAQRAMQFHLGWFLDPIAFGDYPKEMHTRVGSRLPKFSLKQSLKLRHSFDFIGINYYTTQYASHVGQHSNIKDPEHDPDINATYVRNGIPIGPRGASAWLYIYPRGIKLLLEYIMQRYQNPPIVITENGVDEYNNASLPLEEALNDTIRVNYHRQHLHFIAKTIRTGADIRGYFAWSLLDNFEWNAGYSVRFGLYFVDYKDRLKRYPKKSAHWFKRFLNR